MFSLVAGFMLFATICAFTAKQMQYLKHADEPDHYEKHTTPRAGVVESPRRDDISVMKSRTTTIYVCSQTESTVEVLLFSSGSTVRDSFYSGSSIHAQPGICLLHEDETPKQGARRWLKERYQLGFLDMETTHTIHRELGTAGVRTAIAVVVRREKLPGADLLTEGHFVAIHEIMAARPDTLSAEVLADRQDLHAFLHPWVRTAGKNQSDCGDAPTPQMRMIGNT